MSVLSDHIESFIIEMLEEEGEADLKRNELANKFNCAPSQINYVLSTRFSPNRGYVIKSRRGGGGFIRVIRLDLNKSDYIMELIESELLKEINMRGAVRLIEALQCNGYINDREREMILAAVSDKALILAGEARDTVRASILKEMMIRMI